MKGKRGDSAAQVALWGLAIGLLVCAGAWFFEEGLNTALDGPGAWAFGDNAALAVVGVGAIVAANVVWAPGAVVGEWGLVAGAAGCAAGAVWVRWSSGRRG